MNRREFLKSAGLAAAIIGIGCGALPLAAHETGADGWPKPVKTMEDKNMILDRETKILVVHFTRSGNTRHAAQVIQKTTGSDLAEIKVVNPYPEAYRATTAQARKEIDAGFKPEIILPLKNIDKYDTIFVGTPNWWSTMAPPVATFLTKFDFSGKTIIPFITHGGGGMADCESDMKKLCPKAVFKKGIALRDSRIDSTDKEVEKWARNALNLK